MTPCRLSALILGTLLAGCAPASDAPAQVGMCWTMTRASPKPGFALLSHGDDNLETCAMHLELTRISQHRRGITGAYQGQYIFVTPSDIGSSESLRGQRFSLFTPGQRQQLDGQIAQLLQNQPPAGKADGAMSPTGAGAR